MITILVASACSAGLITIDNRSTVRACEYF